VSYLWSLMLLWLAVLPSAPQAGSSSLAITISAPVETIKAGSRLYIKITMTDISNDPVDCSSYYVSGTDRRFRIEILNSQGELMKKKDLHPENVPGSFASCMLQPGESVTRDDLVSWANDLTHPGVYTIQVQRVVGKDEKSGIAKSNAITITVTP